MRGGRRGQCDLADPMKFAWQAGQADAFQIPKSSIHVYLITFTIGLACS